MRTITSTNDKFIVHFKYDPYLVGDIRGIPGREWEANAPYWYIPHTSAEQLDQFALKHSFKIAANAQLIIDKYKEAQQSLRQLSRAQDAELNTTIPLYPFQKAGVLYALQTKRVLIADEMGLGKTIQAIATFHIADSYPVTIVCPASLKINWEREITRWTGVDSYVVVGRNDTIPDVLVVIINYEILDHYQLEPRTLVLDESHYIKNEKSKRSRNCLKLAGSAEYVILLTGTPILNRPSELIPQLQALDVLHKFGGKWGFAERYCGAAYRMIYTRTGRRQTYDFSGATNLQELNERLRSFCMVRRLKADVLKELPPKIKAVIPIPIDNREEYNFAEHNLIRWLSETKGKDKALRALRAEQIVKINALKQLAAKGKLQAVISWVDTFLQSDQKLVLFVYHTSVGQQIAEHFKAPFLYGGTSQNTRQEMVDDFQTNPNTRLIVGNMQAMGVGLTLTAASNVAFVELGWTPALHSQAEDRCHRIGQDNSVTAWYLVAHNTIDEKIAKLLDQKSTIVTGATDGEETDYSLLDDLVNSLLTS